MSAENEFDPLEEGESSRGEMAAKLRLENIISSYKDARDVLAEPVQNSMDAIVRADNNSLYSGENIPQLTVTINIDENRIRISDNGRGFPLEELKKYISPEGTDKTELYEQGDVRGHKGVGLSFLAYGFNFFQVKSKTPDGDKYRLVMEDGREWVEGDDHSAASRPRARIHDWGGEQDRGTEITIETDSMSNPSSLAHTFNNPEMTAALLETQTAIGVVPPHDETHPDVEGKLVYIKDGNEETVNLDDKYRYPHEKLNDDLEDGQSRLETINIEEYDYDDSAEDAVDGVLPEDQNCYHGVYKTYDTDEIHDIITDEDHSGESLQEASELRDYISDHDVEAYVLFAYSNDYRSELGDRWDIPGNRSFHKPGIRIASDGMISSWYSSADLTYNAIRESRLWFVYHFEDARPDTGRKDFPQEVHDVVENTKQTLHRRTVEGGEQFLAPTPGSRAIGGGGEDTGTRLSPSQKAIQKEDISPKEIEGFGEIPLKKEPDEEQDTVAIFNQLVGLGVLKAFNPYYYSVNDPYDGYVEYNPDEVPSELTDKLPGAASVTGEQSSITLEFKAEAADVLKHVVNETREWEEMDLLVAWKLGGEDPEDSSHDAKYSYGGRTITFRKPNSPQERRYAGVTHIAHTSSTGDVGLRTISLKELSEEFSD